MWLVQTARNDITSLLTQSAHPGLGWETQVKKLRPVHKFCINDAFPRSNGGIVISGFREFCPTRLGGVIVIMLVLYARVPVVDQNEAESFLD